MKKKLFSLFLVLAIVLSLSFAMAVTASADAEPDYLTFTGTEEFTLFIPKTTTNKGDNPAFMWQKSIDAEWKKGTLEYSTDGESWTNVTAAAAGKRTLQVSTYTTITTEGYTISSGAQKKIYLRGSGISAITCGKYDDNDYHIEWQLTPATENGTVAASGNIMTLLDYTDPDNAKMGDYCFYRLFEGCSSLTAAPELPATQLADYCYRGMFSGCSSLTAAPELPATQLVYGCYFGMFWNCSSLTAAPELPATQLADYCYSFMFRGCSSLTDAPELPATQLADGCYSIMFEGCSSLTEAPDLPAEDIPSDAYGSMFAKCIALQQPPEIAAQRLSSPEGDSELSDMFSGCYSLRTAPEIRIKDLQDSTFVDLFIGCYSLQTAPQLNIDSMSGWGTMAWMFENCALLKVEQATEADYDWDFRDVDMTNDDMWLYEMLNGTATDPSLEITAGTPTSLYKVSSLEPAAKVSFDRAEVLFADIESAVKFVNNTVGSYLLSEDSVVTVTLLDNCTLKSAALNFTGQAATLDLNGYVLKGSGTASVINVNSGAELTIKDRAPAKTHYFTVQDTGLWKLDETNNSADYTFDAKNGLRTKAGDATDDIPAQGKVIAVSGGCITGGIASGSCGGGILSNGTVSINGGNVVGNTAQHGGGLYGDITFDGGCVVGNTAVNGGGGIGTATTSYIKSGRISYNRASGTGGGMQIGMQIGNSSTGIMTGGIVKNNIANYGGGVFMWPAAKFTATGGFIENNIANLGGGGIGCNDVNDVITLGGSIRISGNKKSSDTNNIGLFDRQYIIIADGSNALTSGARIGVTLNSGTGQFTTNAKANDVFYFFSDKPEYGVKYNSGNYLELVKTNIRFTDSCFVNGTTLVDNVEAQPGDKVQVITRPDYDYLAGLVTVTDAAGNSIKVINNSFVMPEGLAYISVSYYLNDHIATPKTTVFVQTDANGTVNVSDQCADKGDTVVFTPQPNAGYVVGSISVVDAKGSELSFTRCGEDSFSFVMPAGTVTVKVGFVAADKVVFTDVKPDSYYYPAVKWAAENGIASGIGGGLFAPESIVTRAQFVTFLWRAIGSPAVNYAHNFVDVADSAYYAAAVKWGVSCGVIAGTSATTFSPDQPVTRAQAVSFLWRHSGAPVFANMTANGPAAGPFVDVPSNAYYYSAVLWAVGQNITAGKAAAVFAPNDKCQRCDAVTFIYRSFVK